MRAEAAKIAAEQPNYAEALCVLGMADAALGNKEDAIREGRRAVELLPVTKDAIIGARLVHYLALIYAWTGEKDLALEQLSVAASLPNLFLSYGYLRLHPYWDPLRGDPRFERWSPLSRRNNILGSTGTEDKEPRELKESSIFVSFVIFCLDWSLDFYSLLHPHHSLPDPRVAPEVKTVSFR